MEGSVGPLTPSRKSWSPLGLEAPPWQGGSWRIYLEEEEEEDVAAVEFVVSSESREDCWMGSEEEGCALSRTGE